MSDRHDDEAFVDRLRTAWPAPTFGPSDRVRFDAVLRDRIAQRSRRRRAWFGLGLAGAVAAAAFTLFTLTGPVDIAPPAPAPAIAADVEAFAPLAAVLATDAFDDLGLDDVGLFADDDLFAEDDLYEEGATEYGDDSATAAADADADEADEDPGWMPDEYDTLAMLIDVDPYTTEELWP